MSNELQVPKSNKVADWKRHAQECHERITELMMLNPEIEVEDKDNEFLRLPAVVSVQANSPAPYKDSWGIPRVAEMEIVIHTSQGVFVCKNMEVLKWKDGCSVDVPKDTYKNSAGETVKKPHFAGRRFLDHALATFNEKVEHGFTLTSKFQKRTRANHDALMGLTDRKYVPKDKATKGNNGTSVDSLDEAKAALGG